MGQSGKGDELGVRGEQRYGEGGMQAPAKALVVPFATAVASSKMSLPKPQSHRCWALWSVGDGQPMGAPAANARSDDIGGIGNSKSMVPQCQLPVDPMQLLRHRRQLPVALSVPARSAILRALAWCGHPCGVDL